MVEGAGLELAPERGAERAVETDVAGVTGAFAAAAGGGTPAAAATGGTCA